MQQKINASIGALQLVLVALVQLNVVALSDKQIAGIVAASSAVLLAVAGWFSPSVPVGKSGSRRAPR